MPYNVKHVKHFEKDSSESLEEFIQEAVPVFKEGWLGKRKGKENKTFWVEVINGQLKVYKSNKKDKLVGSIEIFGSILYDKDISLTEFGIKSNELKDRWTFVGSESTEIEEWKSTLLGAGAISIKVDEIAKKKIYLTAQRKKLSKLKQEEEYINQEKSKRTNGLSVDGASLQTGESIFDEELLRMHWDIVPIVIRDSHDNDVKELKQYSFKIKVSIGDFHWSINRSYSMVEKYIKNVKTLLPVNGCLEENVEDKNHANAYDVQTNMNTFVKIIVGNREWIIRDKKYRKGFIKFIAPLQWQDEKPDGFVLPFSL
ncbi:hypothetical protein SAMD00019534_061300 [Acytostelium subglobosum LB1]|uniref:hypothetical protein n=1 Tax=Acytostelium subglobosum LB1 TaxID=1410327 RepID=UPI000644A332|nr:hypothetical protein SAMD00019534_061300 [Acytostelium subglobosum LB1]GAM22955.1 hypothetical protein SAMD00019534_061300 [Acytostelium subglobosum LB1]|eukprot:XP_012754182.1 hypothetical protein SAMD00019534_061300 [Acytostelium subglobosum LB1]